MGNKLKSITILSNISKIQEYAFLNCSNLECILYYGTNNPEMIYDNSFSGCEKLSFIITYLTYSSETFGSFKVQKTSELPLTCHIKSNRLKSGEIESVVICSFRFIVIIFVVLFWVYNFSTVMLHSQLFVYNNRKKENRKKTKKHFEYLLK